MTLVRCVSLGWGLASARAARGFWMPVDGDISNIGQDLYRSGHGARFEIKQPGVWSMNR
jgi:hypothetical protein